MVFFGRYNIDPVYVEDMYPTREYDWPMLTSIQRELSEMFNMLYRKAQGALEKLLALQVFYPEFEDAVKTASKRVKNVVKATNISLGLHGKAVTALLKSQNRLNNTKDRFKLAVVAF